MTNEHEPSEKLDTSIRAGVFSSVEQAETVVDKLLSNGFSTKEITVFSPSSTDPEHFTEEEPRSETGVPKKHIAAGSTVGATLGGFTAAAGLATVGGIPVVVAGGLAALMAGGVAGGLIGAMTNRGVAKEPADYYDQAVEKGKILVAVEPYDAPNETRLELASEILASEGAEPIPLREG